MITYKKLISITKIFFLSSLLFLMTTGRSYSQVNTDNLVDNVQDKIANYYTETFQVTANKEGVIKIEGEVGTLFDKLKIGELISQVKGVKAINNEIEVQTSLLPDDVIKANIEEDLQRNNVILEPERIKVDVKNRVVHLSGTVSYFREKLMAQSVASWEDGVVGMTSDITVLSPVTARSDANLSEIILDLLAKNYPLEKNVKLEINNGVVDLFGTVTNLFAKNHIAEDIQHIIGVKNVINEIQLEDNSGTI
ncbi:MAG: BON domain-containing protein [Ignavibacteriaceae bacterium]